MTTASKLAKPRPVGDVRPFEGDAGGTFLASDEGGEVLAGEGEGDGISLVEVEVVDERAVFENEMGEKPPAGAEVGDAAVQSGGQVIGERARSGIDAVPAEDIRDGW